MSLFIVFSFVFIGPHFIVLVIEHVEFMNDFSRAYLDDLDFAVIVPSAFLALLLLAVFLCAVLLLFLFVLGFFFIG